jgi:hypothetical protein
LPKRKSSLIEVTFHPSNNKPVLAEARFDATYFESQMRLLQSEGVALSVVRKLQIPNLLDLVAVRLSL